MTQRRFRWAVCQLDRLRRCFPASIRHALDELPKTLDETYERILLEIDEEKRVYAIRLFQCLAFSRRPLRIKELAEVLAIQFDTAIPALNTRFRPGDAEEAILLACSTLVITIKLGGFRNLDPYDYDWDYPSHSRVVQFSHYSVKEFLISERLAKSNKGDISQFHISSEPAHTILAQSCISTLLQLDHIGDISDSYPLAKYAARNWFHHARCDGVATRIQDGMEHLFDPDRNHLEMWYSIHTRYGYEKPSPLYHAALCGFESLVEYLVNTRRLDPNQSRGDLGTPLHVAILSGQIGIVQLLLSHGADVNALDKQGDSPLHTAVLLFRDPAIWDPELAGRVDAKIRSHYAWSSLPEAVESRHLDAAQLLIKHGADINAPDYFGHSPLFNAVMFETLNFVELLLKGGADVNIRIYDSTPLLRALLYENFDIAQSFIGHGADVNALESDEGNSPLSFAGFTGGIRRPDLVELLLNAGADANIRNFDEQSQQTPLHEAAKRGNLDIVQLLINHGADINALDCNRSSPLHKAARSQKPKVDERPLKGGADANIRKLYEAAERGYFDIVELLISHGADVNALDCEKYSPLHEAVRSQKHKVVELLLKGGADVNVQNNYYSTTLHEAVESGSLETLQSLLTFGQGADVNARGQYRKTPLHLASSRGFLDMSRLLIEHGADVDAQDDEGQTPFSAALASGHRKLARLLSNDRVSEHDV